MKYYEMNLDGLVGPTHFYGGLASGNKASEQNALSIANPLAAVQQGLDKMSLMLELGLEQAVIIPQARPNIPLLKKLGFQGSDANIIQQCYKLDEKILHAAFSASNMWTANAATVAPSCDTADQKVHLATANLVANFHRHQESYDTAKYLKAIFEDENHFTVHQPLPSVMQFGDEGAANHTRLRSHLSPVGTHVFVYGGYGLKPDNTENRPQKYPVRQTLEASEAIARLNQLDPNRTVFIRQNPKVIDAGVFHNDVIAVGNKDTFFVHEQAFANQIRAIEEIQRRCDFEIQWIQVNSQDVSLSQAISSYLFNSQLLSLPNDKMLLLAPIECKLNQDVHRYLKHIQSSENNIDEVRYIDCRQSMKNGGGPACLRLRLELTQEQLLKMHQGVRVTPSLLQQLYQWSDRHYREKLEPRDLCDPSLVNEVYTALDELTEILGIGAHYYFQK